jgi:hypothetical protein
VESKPTTFTPTAHTHTKSDITDFAHTHVSADITDLKENLKYLYIYGKAQSAITKGQAVQFAGVQGDHILMKPAVPSEINANPDYFIGLAESTLATDDFGYVLTHGELSGINTSSYTQGDILWFASAGSTAGALTQTEPTGLNARIQVAAVNRTNPGNGIIFVRVHNVGVQVQDIVASGTRSASTFLNGEGEWATVSGGGGDFLPLTGGTLSGLLTVSRDTKNHLILSGSTDTAKQMMMGYDVTNNYSYIQSVQQMVAYTNLIFNQDGGNVGIGNTSPDHRLVVGGAADTRVQVDSSSTQGIYFTKSGANNGTFRTSADGDFEFFTKSVNQALVLKAGGALGIGTTDPSRKLDVNGSSRFRDTMFFGGSDSEGLISWNANGFVILGESGKGMAFGANGVNNHMYINTSGNVGIGTTSPSTKLHVVGTALATELRPTGSTNNGRIYADDWGIKVGTDSGHVWIGPANTGHAHIYTDRPTFYFNKDLLVNGSTVYHTGNLSPITTSNIGSQSVAYSTNSGNSYLLNGYNWDSAGKDVRGSEIYVDGWFRNYNAGVGLYNQATTQHWYSTGNGTWRSESTTSTSQIQFATSGNATRGSVIADSSNNIGFRSNFNIPIFLLNSLGDVIAGGSRSLGGVAVGSYSTAQFALPSGVKSLEIQMIQDGTTQSNTIQRFFLTTADIYSLSSSTRNARITWFNGSVAQTMTVGYYVSGSTFYIYHTFSFTVGYRVYCHF